jgi:hypothetical protein
MSLAGDERFPFCVDRGRGEKALGGGRRGRSLLASPKFVQPQLKSLLKLDGTRFAGEMENGSGRYI